MAIHRCFAGLGLCAMVILAGATAAEAQKGRRKGTPVNPNAAIIVQLQGTAGILKQADHDYKGHRVKAIHHIHHAVKALGGGKQPKIASGTGKLPQSQSDALLQKAMQNLAAIQATVANTQGPGNRAAAVMALQNAIGELQTALKIR